MKVAAMKQEKMGSNSSRVNTILSWGIAAYLCLLPVIVVLGASAGMLRACLVILGALIVLRISAMRYLLRSLPSLISRIPWATIPGHPLLRAAWFPCVCILSVSVIPGTPAWLGQASLALLFPALLLINHRVSNTAARVAVFVLALSLLQSLLWILHFDAEVAPIGVDSIQALFQTDLREAWQFVAANTNERFVRLIWVLVACAALALIREMFATAAPRAAWGRLSEPHLWLLLTVALLLGSSDQLSARMVRMASSFQASVESFREEQAAFVGTQETYAVPEKIDVAGPAPDIVVYIGESTTRRHMGIYGYPRNTTPNLAALGGEIIRFDDAAAPHTHTARALREMLTDLNFNGKAGLVTTVRHPPGDPARPYNILDVLNAAGMKTWWLSNHNQFGIWDNPVTNIADRARQKMFFRKSVGKSFDATYFDDYMVKQAAELIESEKTTDSRAIFIHSYAGHADYCKNIPEPWRTRFSASWSRSAYFGDFAGDLARVDCYDSAISYIDNNLHLVIEAARRNREPMIVLYVADHGEDVDDGSGHNSELHTYQHTAVPLVMFFNDAARAALPQQIRNLEANRRLPFETADLYHLLADLAGVNSFHLDRTRSPASDSYRTRPRHILPRGMHWLSLDTEPLKDSLDLRDPVELAQANLRRLADRDRAKLCMHHVDTLAKLREATFLLPCVEFDAVFDSATSSFRVYHPPNPDLGLDLETYLVWAGPVRLWMDLKNLEEANLDGIFAALVRLDAKYGFKQRMVIEIGSDFLGRKVPVDHFRRLAEGWRLSLYLPTDQGLRCRDPSLTASVECVSLEKRIIDTMGQFGFRHISFDSELFPWVRDSASLSRLSMLTWKLSEVIQRSDLNFVKQDLFRKSEIFLVPMQSRYSSGQFDCCGDPVYKTP